MRSRHIALLIVVVLAVVTGGCTAAKFAIANLPARFGDVQRIAAVPYGLLPEQRLDIYRPANAAPDALLPVVVFFHGGGWSNGSREQYRFVGTALAERGMVGVVVNYRLYPAVRFPAFVDDAAAATAWTLREIGSFGGNRSQVFLAGHSAGAHLAALIALDTRYLTELQTDSADIRGVIGLSGPYDFLPLDTQRLRRIFAEAREPRDSQPVAFARADAPPFLLLHGRADTTVRPRNSRNLARALDAVGVPVELRLYDGVGHSDTVAAFSALRRNLVPVLDEIEKFVRRIAARAPNEALPQAAARSTLIGASSGKCMLRNGVSAVQMKQC